MVVKSTEIRGVGNAAVSADLLSASPPGDDPSDQVIKRLFAVTIELHAALGLIENRNAARRVDQAISGLDDVIKALLGSALDSRLSKRRP
jgi:hypothetical protein